MFAMTSAWHHYDAMSSVSVTSPTDGTPGSRGARYLGGLRRAGAAARTLDPVPPLDRLKVQAVAQTQFPPPLDAPWETDAEGGQALAEFAGRACYQSWDKANPAHAPNEGSRRPILEVGHLSVLEHATVTLYVCVVSRSVTHELIRHRHFSCSQ